MNRISSVVDRSSAYLSMLSRLDTDGDGVLSRSERAAGDKPGILTETSQGDETKELAPKLSDGVLAFMMGTRQVGNSYSGSQSQGSVSDVLYRNTYGQYDLDIAP
jgi:hypothetical protein